jgi:beta-glucosidase
MVLYCGNPVDVEEWVDGVDAVLNAHFPGQEGGQAVVDVVMGRVNPSGRLATTWWKGLERSGSFGWFPAEKHDDGDVTIRYGEGVGVGYRRGEEGVRWAFGFGLSYTEFWYSGLQVEIVEGVLRCDVVVRNRGTGTREGREVVQLYVLPERHSLSIWRPEKELKAFAKIRLSAGESRHIVLEVDLKIACSYWDESERCWRMEKGTYWVQVQDCLEKFAVSDMVEWNHL